MKEAKLYKKLNNKAVECRACHNFCKIDEGKAGICGVRQNKDGKLYLLVYGKAVAANLDPIEKKPLFHFLPGTQIFSVGTLGCNFSCGFCQNWDISQAAKIKDVKVGDFGYDLTPQEIIEAAKKEEAESVAYTYNEPTVFFEYACDTAKLAKEAGLKNVFVSNGYQSTEALEKIRPYLDAINIDLKAFSEDFYLKVCKARLQPVLENIRNFFKAGVWVEVTTLLVPGQNDSEGELSNIAEFLVNVSPAIPWHISAFHPDYQMTDLSKTPFESLLRAYQIGKRAGLKYVYLGNVFDETYESTYCPNCQVKIISREGYAVRLINFKDGKCQKCGEQIEGIWK